VATVLPDLSIRQFEYLVAVAESPTWAEAADSVGVSASALSQGLAELERRMGVPLFDRDGRRRVLRPGATTVLDHARQVVALTTDLARWAERARSANVGAVRLGMIDVAAVHHFPDKLAQYRAEHPDVDFRLRVAPSAELVEQLRSGQLDIIVCVEPAEAVPGMSVREVMSEELAIYRPDKKRLGRAQNWGPWVLFPEGSHTRALISHELRLAGASIDVVAESHQPDVIIEMVKLGLGWTVLPVAQAEAGARPLHRGRILTRRNLVSMMRSGSAPDPAVAALRSTLFPST